MEYNVLREWEITREDDYVVVRGRIYNDIKKRFDDGTHIQTSMVLKADFVSGIIETRNSVYHLAKE